MSAVGGCTLDGRKTSSKRKSEESVERRSKRSRTKQCPSNGCSETFNGPSSSANAASSASAYTGSPASTGETQSLGGPNIKAALVSGEIKTRGKKRSTSAVSQERQRKRTRQTASPAGEREISTRRCKGVRQRPQESKRQKPSPSESPNHQAPTKGSSSDNTAPPHSRGETQSLGGPNIKAALVSGEIKTRGKKRSTSAVSQERQRKRTRQTASPAREREITTRRCKGVRQRPQESKRQKPSPSESPNHQATTKGSSSDNTAPPHSRAAFEAKYEEGKLLGEGGFASVFAGHRKEDNLPVAIKRIPRQSSIELTLMDIEGKSRMVPLEVALLLKLQPKTAGTSAVVALLDWYDLDDVLIIVQERPMPCLDMIDYLKSKPSSLSENEAKALIKQLVEALIEVHSRGVFHRDIKLDNILIETSSDIPRVKLIDFGSGTFLSEGRYDTEQGSFPYTSPEWFFRSWYLAEPTTVWQLGIVLFGMLHKRLPFDSRIDIVEEDPDYELSLSLDCQDFLMSCLLKVPEARPSLEKLKHHPWLM